jgi:hypothetical protein
MMGYATVLMATAAPILLVTGLATGSAVALPVAIGALCAGWVASFIAMYIAMRRRIEALGAAPHPQGATTHHDGVG